MFLRCLIVSALAVLMVACRQSSPSTEPNHPTIETPSTPQLNTQSETNGPPNSGEFQDVLNEFMGLNERLERIAARIMIANADLCDTVENDIGLSTHTLNDYPADLKTAAAHYLKVGQGLSVRTVRPQSPAHKAGMRTGDRIVKINETSLIDSPLFTDNDLAGPIAKAAFHSALDKLHSKESAVIDYQRGDNTRRAELVVTPKCKLPVTLFFSEDVNGHLIDDEIWITSGLLRTIRDDVRVAYIMGHEMAHALRGHVDTHTPDIELEADRLGLILLARAGYDPETLSTFWTEQIDLFDGGDTTSDSHPDLISRKDNFTSTLAQIKAANHDDDTLKSLFFR